MAVFTATLTGGKLALMGIPNVEIVTALLIVYSVILGPLRGATIAVTFCCIECMLWGFGFWVPIYFIHWPAIAIMAGLINRKHRHIWLTVAMGIVATALYGVQSTIIECMFMGALPTGRFWDYFAVRYASGAVFFITHMVSNAIFLPTIVPLLTKILDRLYLKRGSSL